MQWNLQPTYKVWHNDNKEIYLWGEKKSQYVLQACYSSVCRGILHKAPYLLWMGSYNSSLKYVETSLQNQSK